MLRIDGDLFSIELYFMEERPPAILSNSLPFVGVIYDAEECLNIEKSLFVALLMEMS